MTVNAQGGTMLKRLAAILLLCWPAIATAEPVDTAADAIAVIDQQVAYLGALADEIETAVADPTAYVLGDPLGWPGLIVVYAEDVDQFVGFLQVLNLTQPEELEKAIPLVANTTFLPKAMVDAILVDRAAVLAPGGQAVAQAAAKKLDQRQAVSKALKEIYKQIGALEARSAALKGGAPWPPGAAPAPAPAAPAPAPEPVTQVFSPAVLGGAIVDACLYLNANCGQPAADNFCKVVGFASAVNFQAAPFRPTLVLGSNQLCNEPHCNGLFLVTCQK